MEYRLEQKVKVVVSRELSKSILEILADRKYAKPLIVIDKFLLETPEIKKLLASLEAQKIDFVIHDEVVPDPPTSVVDHGAQIFNDNNCDCVIGIGGGSSIDSARGINIVRTFGGKISDYANGKEITERCPGLIAVPTTSGTGSELSNALIVSDETTHEKLAILSNNAVSEFAILDPVLVATLPQSMTIATGLDTFAHAAEGYTSNLSTPVLDAICEKIMYLVVKYLPKAVANGEDLEARQEMMVAAALGGWVLNNSGTHVGHSQAHVLGPIYKIPHGMACAYAMPGTLEYTAPVKPKKIREIGYILGASFPEDATDLEIGQVTAEKFKDFRDNVLGLRPFADLEVDHDDLMTNVSKVVNERFAGNAPMEIDDKLAGILLEMFG
ncbi:iron-containing alcohol dehydrogenase [Lactobacillus sp. YT155]|uniref:iron-containing alcohol dehydrogenase n=1 Tax=Lactobacillus sp. YT155 TaxID=3060955 RepID=UPI00265ED396|nr:iron-containing alcohol dehydrogenase [Lactobacillus sp. YT155]MDO1605814.1 iron-containing alcohol dehydrogenase [Lactobacillus sp. YT155]